MSRLRAIVDRLSLTADDSSEKGLGTDHERLTAVTEDTSAEVEVLDLDEDD